MRDPSARNVATPLVTALRLALEEAAETRRRRELERAVTRRTLRVVDGKRDEA